MVLERSDVPTLDVACALGRLADALADAGLTLAESADFAAFAAAAEASEDRYLMEDFSPKFFDLHADTGFWIAARDADGQVASLQAAKIETLRDRSLAALWQQQQRRIFVDPANGAARLGEAHAVDAFALTGRIVYHGNLWLRKDLRGRGLAEKLTQTGFLVALLKWQPDWLYGLMAEANALKGFGLRVGYRRFAPRGTHWLGAPAHIRPDDWLVWSSRTDLVTLARTLAGRSPG
ncbi:hypothetical protein GWI72_07430 [Microvirga tunisiensis]|uniref:GNAT family N-acetyltransferase n=1 Tax=Pannonibacter tanglangensis TaxID=2750084 RepID=A0A7X5F1K7_9HYPH|nr:hypothetical protein [Pannonibacter sp. XCT-53]NBN78095.1 hypothetical protein [Pannonibacter sp. XCT-53]